MALLAEGVNIMCYNIYVRQTRGAYMTENKGFVMLSRSEKNKGLPLTARVLLSEITSLCARTGTCYATNAYFAEQYGLSERTISKYVNLLLDKQLIEVGRSSTLYGRMRIMRPRRTEEERKAIMQARQAMMNSASK